MPAGDWADYLALLAVALIIEKHVFAAAWPIPGLSGLEKLLFVDVVLYEYLVVRTQIGIGFDLRARLSDLAVGLREFAFYAGRARCWALRWVSCTSTGSPEARDR